MRIWDLHCHPSAFLQGATPDAAMAATLRLNDRMGIERMCIYLGVGRGENPPPDELRAANDYVLRCMRAASDRVFGFAYVNPNYAGESLAEMERCIADGPMVGIKLWVARRCSDAAIDPIIRRAGQLKAAIFQHTWFKVGGNLPGEPTPTDLTVLAARHRGVPLICGHTGGQWELGVRAVRPVTAISVDLAGSDPTAGFTEMAVRELGPDRVIWGSDAGGRSLASQLSKVLGARLSDEVKQKIFMGNLRQMLLPIFEAKGIRA